MTASYTPQIIDKNGNTILEKDIKKLHGGETNIISKKLDMNDIITVNIYRTSDMNKTSVATIEIDLSNLKKKEKQQTLEMNLINYKLKDFTFNNIKLKIPEQTFIELDDLNNRCTINSIREIGVEEYAIKIECNQTNKSLEECYKRLLILNQIARGYSEKYEFEENIWNDEIDKSFVLSLNEIESILNGETIVKDGYKIKDKDIRYFKTS